MGAMQLYFVLSAVTVNAVDGFSIKTTNNAMRTFDFVYMRLTSNSIMLLNYHLFASVSIDNVTGLLTIINANKVYFISLFKAI